ncbi:MAG TPA: hypothetical protein DHN33_02170 [Eubacteriaceae bacterium]|nr:hypothetical protein [Eubacteriaceae bacterium]
MNEKIKTFIQWGAVGNLAHLVVAALHIYMGTENTILITLNLLLVSIAWFAVGYKIGGKSLQYKETDYLLFGLICILPMLIYIIAAQSMQWLSESLTIMQNFNLFYFIGAPTLFWSGPFYPIMNLFPESNIYIQMNINLILIMFIVFLGGYLGKSRKIYLKRKKKRQMKEQNR